MPAGRASPRPGQVVAHAWREFALELSGDARGSFAGWLWHLLVPLAPLGVYLALAFFRVFSYPDGIAPAVYMTVGGALWMLFAGLVTAPMQAISSKGALAAKTGHPLLGVVLSKVMHVLFETSVRAGLIAVIMFWQQPPANVGLGLLAMLASAPLYFGLGLILALFSTAVRDLERVTPLVLQYAFFLSFAIFPVPLPEGWIALNPFAIAIDNTRHVLMFGVLSTPVAFSVWAGVGLLACIQALRFLGRAEPLVVGHL